MLRDFFNNLSLKNKLTFTYLVISIAPFIIISFLMLSYFTKNLEQQAFNQLSSLRDVKKSHLDEYIKQVQDQIQYLVGNIDSKFDSTSNTYMLNYLASFREDIKPLAEADKDDYNVLQKLFIVGTESEKTDIKANRDYYDYTHEDIHPFLKKIVDQFGFDNLYLVTNNGNIVYSVIKEKSFGQNLVSGEYSNTGLGKAFKSAKQAVNKHIENNIIFIDFDKIDSKISSFISVPLYEYRKFQGAVIFQLPFEKVDKVMSARTGLGSTGETYLVGQDHFMRSNGYRAPDRYSLESTVSGNSTSSVSTVAVNEALNGKTDILVTTSYLDDEVLSAYTPINVFNMRWALVAEVTTKEAFATIKQLQQLAILIAVVVIGVIFLIGYLTASTIAKPILALTTIAEKIAGGNLQQAINIQRKDEIGSLASSFATMREAVADKIHKIEQQNIELKKLDEFKNDLLANTTHELKTPLNGIIGLAESLVGRVPDRYNKTLVNIINSGRRLSNLVNDILDVAKLKQKQIQLKTQPLNLRQIVDLDISISASLIGKKPVSLVNLVPNTICVCADQHRLQQIFQNLIGNAIKFTNSGEVKIFAKPSKNIVEIIVSDTGIGINPEDQMRIFDAFEQTDSGANRSYGGTGLGLAITKQLVELHGGNIRVESTPAKGTRFIFTLSISDELPKINHDLAQYQESSLEAPVEFSEILESPQINQGQVKDFVILAVDDEPINLDIILNHLSESSLQVIPAHSGEEALICVREKKPDLVLLDVMMPEMDGYEVCQILREEFTSYDLPIIFLTARNQLRDLVHGFNMGGNDYLTKPFFKDELLARVKIQLELLTHRKRMSQLHQFSNNICEFKSHEEMVMATYKLLVNDPLIDDAATFFEGKTLSNSASTDNLLARYPSCLEQEAEFIETSHKSVAMFVKISSYYTLAASFPKSSSEEWIRNIALQTQRSVEQIRRISANPDNALIQKHITPILHSILYIKVEKNYCVVVKLINDDIKEEIIRIPLKKILFFIESELLFQVHRSYIVSPSRIKSISSSQLTIYLEFDQQVPLAKKYLPELKKHYPEKFKGALLV
ncbi:ATP-binding protein [Zooshikella sp. RANM57]|uniref:ATP-binding protein n=1 Tax=Zooshikella sp. RANM57 TaxID=3425863 RepID=UPI003D6F1972